MPSTLAYWNLRGRVHGIRLMLVYVGEDWEDKYYEFGPAPEYSFDPWFKEKFTRGLDFPNLPYYNDGKVNISQTHGILRYLSMKYQMEGTTDEERMRIILADEESRDFLQGFANLLYNRSLDFSKATCTMDIKEEKKCYLEKLPIKLKQWDDFLGDRLWLAGDKISYVDFAFYSTLEMHQYLDKSYIKDFPKLQAYLDRFEEIPNIKKYLASDKCNRYPIAGPHATLCAYGKSEMSCE